MFLETKHSAGSAYEMRFIAVLRGNSATAQEETAKGAANQVYFLAKLIKAWVEAILDCQLFYGKTMKAWEVGVDFGGDLGWTGKSRYCHILPHCYRFPLKLTLKAWAPTQGSAGGGATFRRWF